MNKMKAGSIVFIKGIVDELPKYLIPIYFMTEEELISAFKTATNLSKYIRHKTEFYAMVLKQLDLTAKNGRKLTGLKIISDTGKVGWAIVADHLCSVIVVKESSK